MPSTMIVFGVTCMCNACVGAGGGSEGSEMRRGVTAVCVGLRGRGVRAGVWGRVEGGGGEGVAGHA